MPKLRTREHRAVMAVIAATRREKGLRQADLARLLGWQQSKLARIESGERQLLVPELLLMARALGMTSTALITRIQQWADSIQD
jgi:transcriptional regulator with XRE-family HTH domain